MTQCPKCGMSPWAHYEPDEQCARPGCPCHECDESPTAIMFMARLPPQILPRGSA